MIFKDEVQVAIDDLIHVLQTAPEPKADEYYRVNIERRKNGEQPIGLAEWVIP